MLTALKARILSITATCFQYHGCGRSPGLEFTASMSSSTSVALGPTDFNVRDTTHFGWLRHAAAKSCASAPNASREGRVCAHHDSRSQSYSSRATPFPGFGNRTNTSGSCPGMINRGLVASCFIRSCAARFDLASSVTVIGTCLSRFSYR